MSLTSNRRSFLKSTAAITALSCWPFAGFPAVPTLHPAPRRKAPARIRGAFFYPPAEVVLAGDCEDGWSRHQWFTWPGNQFAPEEQQAKFVDRLREITRDLDVDLALDETAIHTDQAIQAFMGGIRDNPPDALLLFNFWNSFSPKIRPILDAYDGPIILYHPVGANHQLPPEYFRTAPRVQYIHSIENWPALERGLRAVHAWNRVRQSRLLRISGQVREESHTTEPFFHTAIHTVPAESFNTLFDRTEPTPAMRRFADAFRNGARRITDLTPESFLDAARAHAAVLEIMDRHDADAITIECLFLKHRKPCLSFAFNNGLQVPCGCENDLNATLTLLLGTACFGRGGFQHNPEFDTEENLYFASHCTCTTRLHGPDQPGAVYDLRPFFHQLPKTPALDVQWPPGEPVTLCKYHSGQQRLEAWRGEVVSSPAAPPTGGCATRVLVRIDRVPDVLEVYGGPHPVLYCGDFARHLQTFARLYSLEFRGNC